MTILPTPLFVFLTWCTRAFLTTFAIAYTFCRFKVQRCRYRVINKAYNAYKTFCISAILGLIFLSHSWDHSNHHPTLYIRGYPTQKLFQKYFVDMWSSKEKVPNITVPNIKYKQNTKLKCTIIMTKWALLAPKTCHGYSGNPKVTLDHDKSVFWSFLIFRFCIFCLNTVILGVTIFGSFNVKSYIKKY